MNIVKGKTKIELSEEDVKDIVASYLRDNGYEVDKSDVTVSVGTRMTGYYTNEHQEPYFKCVTAVVK